MMFLFIKNVSLLCIYHFPPGTYRLLIGTRESHWYKLRCTEINPTDDDDCFYHYKKQFIPLIEGLCAQIQELRFEIICGLRSHLLLFFFGRKNMLKEKKHLVQDHIPPLEICIHMCTLYTYTNICMSRFSPFGFFGPSRCLIPTPGLTSEHLCSVCVCVYTHTHTHLHSHPR